jgi:hypothetical protein
MREQKMNQRVIGVILALLVFVAFLNSDTAVASSPFTMIVFGSYLLGIGWFGKEKEEKRKEYPLASAEH